MNKLIRCQKVENCFANAQTYRYWLDGRVDEDVVKRLQFFGTSFVKRNLRRPFFRIEMEEGSQIKGMFGDDSIKVSYSTSDWEEEKEQWEQQAQKILEQELG